MRWHESQGGGDQIIGQCDALLRFLKTDNTEMFCVNKMIVFENFGCLLGAHKGSK